MDHSMHTIQSVHLKAHLVHCNATTVASHQRVALVRMFTATKHDVKYNMDMSRHASHYCLQARCQTSYGIQQECLNVSALRNPYIGTQVVHRESITTKRCMHGCIAHAIYIAAVTITANSYARSSTHRLSHNFAQHSNPTLRFAHTVLF